MKFYIVIVGKDVYRFDSWEACSDFIYGKKNLIYKSFVNDEEANNFIKNNIKENIPFDLKNTLYGYVDGSCDKTSYGSGVSLVYNGTEIATIKRHDSKYAQARQIVGELNACLEAVIWAVKNNYKRIVIVYDYVGIEFWYTGSWKSKEVYVDEYIKTLSNLSSLINIDFIHINSHINDGTIGSNWNNRADELAKESLKEDVNKTIIC